MAGSLQYLEPQAGEVERIAIFHRHEGIFRLRASAEMNDCATAVTQFKVAGHEVGVEMAEEDVANLEAKFLGVDKVLMDVALRIHDNGGCAGFVSEQIGRMGKTA